MFRVQGVGFRGWGSRTEGVRELDYFEGELPEIQKAALVLLRRSVLRGNVLRHNVLQVLQLFLAVVQPLP